MLNNLIKKVSASPLSREDVSAAVAALVSEDAPVEAKADFLCALNARGETVEEIAAFASELRERSVRPEIPPRLRENEILDVVGTGGDRLSTFNISTCVAVLSSAAGVYVAKHGNRASTSPVGSADVAEALGIPFDIDPSAAVEMLERLRFCYFFAPKYHPAFKHIAPARKLCAQRGLSTIFNFLGPLLNPGRPSAMLLGSPKPELCEPLARVLQSLGVRRAMVVCGTVVDESGNTRYLDEVSPLGPTHVAEFYHEKGLNVSTIDPSQFPVRKAQLADLRGGDRAVNAQVIRDILNGKEQGPKLDAVLINAAAALFVAGLARNFAEGWELAHATIATGRGAAKLKELGKE